VSSDKRDTLALVRHNLETGKEEVIAAEESVDACDFLIDPIHYKAQAVAFNRERTRWKVVDPEIADDLKLLEKENKGDFSVLSRSRDLQKWIVGYVADVQPLDFYLYDRQTKKLTHLFESYPHITKYKLAPTKPVTIKSRDGLDLVSYLTLPVGVEPKKLPMILLVHGGPWNLRDKFDFSEETQWLANRGYAVLAVNYRGTVGYGKKFMQASYREWGGKMQDDLSDAVDWAVKEGIADPKRVGISGQSYGGYAALAGAAFTPDVFACAVDTCGPSNLITLLNSLPPFLEADRKKYIRRMGDPAKEPEFLKSRSPLFKVDKIKIPLLIGQGANDPRVKKAEAEQIVEAMKKAGKPVTYLLFPDEGHGLAKPENQVKMNTAAETFLAKHLGGRSETAEKPAP
jgi:dipeptidyl aminopeptidase/acylaminoacyl peptidase